MAINTTQKQGKLFIIGNYLAFMAIKAYLLHFSYKLLYFAELIIICKKEQVNICAPLIVSLGYLCCMVVESESVEKIARHVPNNFLNLTTTKNYNKFNKHSITLFIL